MQQMKPNIHAAGLESARLAQRSWASNSVRVRARLMGRLRRKMAGSARELAEIIPTSLPGALSRTVADTMVAEVLPLIEACRFLELEAEWILRSRRLSRHRRPIWLSGVAGEVERAPWGIVLVLGAANYPLFLPGVQTLQALVAGNAVLWKPAPGTEAAAFALRTLLVECGLNPELLTVLESSVEAGMDAIAAKENESGEYGSGISGSGVDHVVLTGSVETGRAVLRQLAETVTPATMELSGCDAVFVLPGADVARTIQALKFGLRFNGSFTCMAPRRVFLIGLPEPQADEFETQLAAQLAELPPVRISSRTFGRLSDLIEDARVQGAEIMLNGLRGESVANPHSRATLIGQATPALLAMHTDIFAPILSVMRAADAEEALAANAACPFALTASIFGPERTARQLASNLQVGNVLINDVVVPTADPRVPFGGRGRSGFGITRGAEGLLAMTTPRTIQVQRSESLRAYSPTGGGHADFFSGLIQSLHGAGFSARWAGLRRLIAAARELK